jgi:hypothetical protein
MHRYTAAPCFVPLSAFTFTGPAGEGVAVDADHPLPVVNRLPAASSVVLSGATITSMAAGPFVPDQGGAIWVTVSGTTGKVSTPAGNATRTGSPAARRKMMGGIPRMQAIRTLPCGARRR